MRARREADRFDYFFDHKRDLEGEFFDHLSEEIGEDRARYFIDTVSCWYFSNHSPAAPLRDYVARNLDRARAASVNVVLGDETSIGLACAHRRRSPHSAVLSLLEVSSLANASDVLTRLALDGVDLFERTEGDAHLGDMERRLPALVADGATFFLTGRAPSIQRLRRVLKASGVSTSRLAAKPYWAPGRTGLD